MTLERRGINCRLIDHGRLVSAPMERGKPWANAVEVLSSAPAASAAKDSFFKIWLLVQVPTAIQAN